MPVSEGEEWIYDVGNGVHCFTQKLFLVRKSYNIVVVKTGLQDLNLVGGIDETYLVCAMSRFLLTVEDVELGLS